jgi:hypothetical protein
MSVHISETTVDPQGRVVLDHLPFQPGEKVDVIVCPHKVQVREPAHLTGSVLRYDDPCQPVVVDDWEIQP